MSRTWMLCLAAALALAGCSTGSPTEATGSDGVFVHITKGTDSPHEVLMGLAMAALMREGGKDVLVYFDIEGIEVVLADAPDLTYKHFASSRSQIEKLIAAGATVSACPGCLKAAGKAEGDLMPGIQLADREKFFRFTRGRILAIDY